MHFFIPLTLFAFFSQHAITLPDLEVFASQNKIKNKLKKISEIHVALNIK